ncbi:MAG: hypothetical protein GX567_09955 [Clostridia bacterium]|nr:hypothetical protein [Clostridia bacterium]
MKIYPTDENKIYTVEIRENGKKSERFRADNNQELSELAVFADQDVADGKYPVDLYLYTDEFKTTPYVVPFTLVAKKTLPRITIKQEAKFDLFDKDSSVNVFVSSNDGVINWSRLDDTATFGADQFKNGKFTLYYSHTDGKPDLDATVVFSLDGWKVEIKKPFKISTVTKKPVIKQNRNSTTLYGDGSAPLQITKTMNKKTVPIAVDAVTISEKSQMFAQIIDQNGEIYLKPILNEDGKFSNGKSEVKVELLVQESNWLTPIAVQHKLTVGKKLPTFKASTNILKLNSLGKDHVDLNLISNMPNYKFPFSCTITPAKASQKVNTDKLFLDYDDGIVSAQFKDTNDLPANGNYQYYLTPALKTGEKLSRISITVKVENQKPTVKLATNKLLINKNAVIPATEESPKNLYVDYPTTNLMLSGKHYVICGIKLLDQTPTNFGKMSIDVDGIRIRIIADGIQAYLTEDVKPGSYKYSIVPVAMSILDDKEIELDPFKLTVTVYDDKEPILITKNSGKIDLSLKDSAITYTVMGSKNYRYYNNEIIDFELQGKDSDKFIIQTISEAYQEPACVKIMAKPDADLKSNKSYKVKLVANSAFIDDDDNLFKFQYG